MFYFELKPVSSASLDHCGLNSGNSLTLTVLKDVSVKSHNPEEFSWLQYIGFEAMNSTLPITKLLSG